MTTSATDNKHPYYPEIIGMDWKNRRDFFTEDNSLRMRFVSLGEVLDFTCCAGMNYVAYTSGSKELGRFIRTWMQSQLPRIETIWVPDPNRLGISTFEEKKEEYGYRWNDFPHSFSLLDLPRINHEICPRDSKHTLTIRDNAGIVRCAETLVKKLKPSFVEKYSSFDGLSGMDKEHTYNNPLTQPPENVYGESWKIVVSYEEEWKQYRQQTKEYDREEAVEFRDTCYAVIREPKNVYLPLETILKRLSLPRFSGCIAFPFLGFELASYVQAWYEQAGEKRFFERPEEHVEFKAFPDYRPWNSDD